MPPKTGDGWGFTLPMGLLLLAAMLLLLLRRRKRTGLEGGYA